MTEWTKDYIYAPSRLTRFKLWFLQKLGLGWKEEILPVQIIPPVEKGEFTEEQIMQMANRLWNLEEDIDDAV